MKNSYLKTKMVKFLDYSKHNLVWEFQNFIDESIIYKNLYRIIPFEKGFIIVNKINYTKQYVIVGDVLVLDNNEGTPIFLVYDKAIYNFLYEESLPLNVELEILNKHNNGSEKPRIN